MNSHKTAISRSKLSTPTKYLLDNDLLTGTVLDYGCGRGDDISRLLSEHGMNIHGYDTHYAPMLRDGLYETIICNYVLNTIAKKTQRNFIVNHIKSILTKEGVAYISVRNDKKNLNGLTKSGTWQGLIELDYPIKRLTSNFKMYTITRG